MQGGFFFSPDMDISRTVISMKTAGVANKTAPTSIHDPDERFFWNKEWCWPIEVRNTSMQHVLVPLMMIIVKMVLV